jgi:heat shock protein HslJ
MKTIFKLAIFSLAFVTANCKKDDPKDLISSKWFLEEIQFTKTQTIDQVPENLRNMNLEFSDSNRLHAISSCNAFDGPYYTFGLDSININVGTTLIYCIDPIIRHWDSLYYHQINKASKYFIRDGKLLIQTIDETVLVFK